MKYRKLGSSDLSVSEVCLGTMTWGQQNSQQDAFEQIDYALDQGINFIDTAEMYAVPPKAETCGLTEEYIGSWLANNKSKRADVILASKITGSGVPWVRDGADITGDSIHTAIEGSLQRLQTDYIDLYQLHWPNRTTPHFNKHWPGVYDSRETDVERQKQGMLDILRALGEAVEMGKIRHIGLSNDSPWGIMQYLSLAREYDLPKIVSTQHEFNLLHLKDHPYVTETCVFENVAYLPWSPLAGGALSGKYANGAKPKNSRWTMVQRNGIFRDTTRTHEAINAFQQVADKYNVSLTQMALAWVMQFNGVTSTIIGATSMQQLEEDIGAYALKLDEPILAEIDRVIRAFPLPF